MNISEPKATQLAELFSALSDTSRIRIVAILLEGERSVSALANGLKMTDSAVSHQLRGLRQMHLVRTRKVGRQVFYTIDDDHVSRLFSLGLEHVQHK